MKTKFAVDEFTRKVISPLVADLTRTLEVTCGKTGEQNHGSNFIGNGVVLIGIETIGQFINPKSQAELETFRKDARNSYKKLSPEQKQFVQPRYTPDNVLGSVLAKRFMTLFFHSRFTRIDKVLGAPLLELVWAFRNPHSHAFYPYVRRQFGGKKINGGVMWLYKSSRKTGISIRQIENNFRKYSRKLYKIEADFFYICPQVLLVYFKDAIECFRRKIMRDESVRNVFLDNYRRLTPVYRFTSLDGLEEGKPTAPGEMPVTAT